MKCSLVRMAEWVYLHTPFLWLRRFYYTFFCYLVRGHKLRTTINSTTFELDLSEAIDVGIFLDRYEPDVTGAIERYCRPRTTVFDIGANIGAHTLRFARIVGVDGKVVAFEPTDFAYHKLATNVSLNSFDHVTTVQVALSDENSQQQEIRVRASWRTDRKLVDTASVIDFVRLDDWCDRNSVDHVDLIKIDVDGNESPIICGGRKIIERCLPIILMEAVSPHFENDATNPFLLLQAMGYRFWNIQSGAEYVQLDEIKAQLPEDDPEMTSSLNVIATTKSLCGNRAKEIAA